MALDELKTNVSKLLVTEHDFSEDEADEMVEASVTTDPELWHENSQSVLLANHLASDDKDE